jgi:hypothetical protein
MRAFWRRRDLDSSLYLQPAVAGGYQVGLILIGALAGLNM